MSLSDESAANATNGKHPPTPFNIDGEPIIYDGNPAHVEGILHELSEWTARTGHYVTWPRRELPEILKEIRGSATF